MKCFVNTCPDLAELGAYFCQRHRELGERQVRVEVAQDRRNVAATHLAYEVYRLFVTDQPLDASRHRLGRLATEYVAAHEELLMLIDRSERPG